MTTSRLSPDRPLAIGLLGAGDIARALGGRWAAHGHTITVAGRSPRSASASALASILGPNAAAGSLRDAVLDADVVLLAVPWDGVDDVLDRVDAAAGGLTGVTVIDPVNPVTHGVGTHRLETGSCAEYIACRSPGAAVVKAFNVFPANNWDRAHPGQVVTIAGDDPAALERVGRLVGDAGATPHISGPLTRARQIEELAGSVIGLAFAGVDPRSVVPTI